MDLHVCANVQREAYNFGRGRGIKAEQMCRLVPLRVYALV